ncbi:hypothetical protein U8D42_28885 (plasmid) [Mycobacterium europaeum]|uniref:hypothetical protein n=1 Tax=Mycobacterium TaxID=1763 RepID=UPI000ABA6826|nr:MULTISPECIES: hypothetical protein [Mycobacterium]MCV7120433.1 hypothetical protein [Mycobacterium nebraskense]MCV7328227.1 hypothetical protein [Mycobacterium intracellulare subsp. chimaera]MEA1162950.1 hypothetical protein [Mycobacterium europaeum]
MSIAAFLAGVDRILTRAHNLYPAGGQGGPFPASGGGSAPASPAGVGGLRTGVTRAAGSYQQARTSAAGLDQEVQQAAEQGGTIGAQGRLGSGVIRDQARAVAAAAGPMAQSPAGARLVMAAMDQHLTAMQGQLQTTKTQNQAVSATLRQTAAGYQTLSDGAKDSPADPTIRAAGWKPGDPLPAEPAPPGLPPVATDPRNPFVGDPRFGYWTDYVPPPYTGSTPPPPAKQHVPWVDGPEGGPTGFYTPGRTWIGDNDAPFAAYEQQYKFRIAGEDLTSYTQVGPGGQMQRWVAYTYEAQEFQNVKLNGDIWVKTPPDASTGGLGGVSTGGIGGISIPPKIGPWQPITPAQIATLSAANPTVKYYMPDPCGQQFTFVNGTATGGNAPGPITPSIIAGPPG